MRKLVIKNFINTLAINFFQVNVDFVGDVLRASQHKLLVMAEKFKESRHKASTVGDFLTYQKLLIALIPHF